MPGGTKNLGQVQGLHIGTSAPQNTTLIWYDETPSQRCHKVWDNDLQQWVNLNPNLITAIQYSVLVNLASSTGLTVGQWYKITDKSNALALAITTTKVQYVDTVGNILIDDLGSNIQYHVAATNLTIDDISGVYDATTNRVVFTFTDVNPGNTANDFLLGKRLNGSVWQFVKYKVSSLISAVAGNSIAWNSGLYFNFEDAFDTKKDVIGGFIGFQTYQTNYQQLVQAINNVADNYEHLRQDCEDTISNGLSDANVYAKKLPATPVVGTAIDVVANDTLSTIITKFQRWVNQFKNASGIRIDSTFAAVSTLQNINNSDTLLTAFQKVQKYLTKIQQETRGIILAEAIDNSQPYIPIPGTSTLQQVLNSMAYSINNNYLSSRRCFQYDLVVETSTQLAALNVIPSSVHSILFKGTLYAQANHPGISFENFLNTNPCIVDFDPHCVLTIYRNTENTIFFKGFSSVAEDESYNDGVIFNGNGAVINIFTTQEISSDLSTWLFTNLGNIRDLIINPVGYAQAKIKRCHRIENVNVFSNSTANYWTNCYDIINCNVPRIFGSARISHCVTKSIHSCIYISDCFSDNFHGLSQFLINCKGGTFQQVSYLTNCDGTFGTSSSGRCNNMFSCYGTFNYCYGMSHCVGTLGSNCFASPYNISPVAADATASGGWNVSQ